MTGGVFTVTIWHGTASDDGQITTQESILWDRKRDGGFPGMFFLSFLFFLLPTCSPRVFGVCVYLITSPIEVKALKSLVRNVIAPERDLGHTDRALKAQQSGQKEKIREEESKDAKACEDCQ
jgi:predicted Rdx family selenoprotein